MSYLAYCYKSVIWVAYLWFEDQIYFITTCCMVMLNIYIKLIQVTDHHDLRAIVNAQTSTRTSYIDLDVNHEFIVTMFTYVLPLKSVLHVVSLLLPTLVQQQSLFVNY